jgi:hypothetical protein
MTVGPLPSAAPSPSCWAHERVGLARISVQLVRRKDQGRSRGNPAGHGKASRKNPRSVSLRWLTCSER